MSTAARAQQELRVLTGNGRPGVAHARRLRRHHHLVQQITGTCCPACSGWGTPDGCWNCGETAAARRAG